MKLFIILLAGLLSMPVLGSELDDARRAGHIVELASGFVEAKAGAPAKARSLAADINRKRREAYTRIAKKHGISVEQVGAESYTRRMKGN